MKNTIKLLLLGAGLLLIGVIIFVSVLAANDWDYDNFGKRVYVTNEHIIEQNFSNFDFDIEDAHVQFFLSETDEIKVVCREKEGLEHSVNVINDTLYVKSSSNKTLLDYIQIDLNRPQIKVYLPTTEYNSLDIEGSIGFVSIGDSWKFNEIDIEVSTGDIRCGAICTGDVEISTSTGKVFIWGFGIENNLSISTSTGSVFIDDIEVKGNIDIEVSTGKVELENVKCLNLNIEAQTGTTKLLDINCLNKTLIKSSTGNVFFSNFYAVEINVNTSTGNVKGTIKSPMDYEASSDTGKVIVPMDQGTNKCIINTNTGDIIITTD